MIQEGSHTTPQWACFHVWHFVREIKGKNPAFAGLRAISTPIRLGDLFFCQKCLAYRAVLAAHADVVVDEFITHVYAPYGEQVP